MRVIRRFLAALRHLDARQACTYGAPAFWGGSPIQPEHQPWPNRIDRHRQQAAEPTRAERPGGLIPKRGIRSEEHTSELQSLMRISYAVFFLKKKQKIQRTNNEHNKNKQA